MIQQFVDRFMAKKGEVRAQFAKKQPDNYAEIVKMVVGVIGEDKDYADDNPDPERIHAIDDGDYQGTLLFVIGATGYQPNDYWYVKVSYGSCSGCDTLEGIRSYDDDPPTEEQINDYMALALHIVQGLKKMDEEET